MGPLGCHKSGALVNGLNTIVRGIQTALWLFLPYEEQGAVSSLLLGRGFLAQPHHAGTLILGYQPWGMWEINFCYWWPSQLIVQLERTKTLDYLYLPQTLLLRGFFHEAEAYLQLFLDSISILEEICGYLFFPYNANWWTLRVARKLDMAQFLDVRQDSSVVYYRFSQNDLL